MTVAFCSCHPDEDLQAEGVCVPLEGGVKSLLSSGLCQGTTSVVPKTAFFFHPEPASAGDTPREHKKGVVG